MRKGLYGSILSIFLLFILSASIAYPGPWNAVQSAIGFGPRLDDRGFRLGLDLQGGVHLIYEADMSNIPDADRGSALAGVRDVIERRVNAYGVSEPLVQTNASGNAHRVIIDLAGVFDAGEATKLIGETPILEFKLPAVEINTEPNEAQQDQIDTAQESEREAALDVLDRALDGESFDALVREFSIDTATKASNGYIGFIDADHEVFGGLADQIRRERIRTGVIDGLYESTSALHIVNYLSQKTEDGVISYEIAHIELPWTTASDILNLDGWENTELSGKHIRNASVAFDQQTGMPFVLINFNSEGAELFGTITEANVGNVMGIFLDSEAISTPVIQQAIYGGEATISGSFTLQEARLLAQRLNAGALPVPIHLVSQQTIGPTLGAESLSASVQAALIGFVLIAIFMIAYYRFAGVLAVIALIVYGAINLAIYKLFGVTMTLAGIAGFILSLGMAIDANVLIFERLKEELHSGRDLATAIDEGFRRAWTSIRDGNITSLIAAFILFTMSTSFVKGFALTLSIGVLVSMFTAITVTRVLLKWATTMKPFKNKVLYNGPKN